ncbi:MAG: LysR family transcriptional regulator [Clostridia bacterium]|nr:LysR family transcriptional regulator [Clostridia bacterium]
MELNQLRYLVTLSKTLNFSKAAEELYISQPSLSQQIRRLEEELGV